MMNTINPKLTEPGVSYFLRETLKQHKTNKLYYYNTVFNISLLLLFIGVIAAVLIYKHKTKLSIEELEKKDIEKKRYILTKIREMNDIHQAKHKRMITNLPKFESEFEKMHNNYYNI